MKFAHLADCHIGSWMDPLLADLSTIAFEKAIDISIKRRVDFVLIAGDLFNTSLPSIDKLKTTVKKLKQLQDNNIPVYIIAGSHDFSPSGKTMLDVLEQAGLAINVARGEVIEDKLQLKFTTDRKTGAKLTGMLGKKGGLEKDYYENLIREPLETENGYKIFLFHTLLTELKPKSLERVESNPLSLLPKNFNYYAGGHPHFVFSGDIKGYGIISYPGPLFPNNFKELEELKNGGFFIVEDNKPEWIPIRLYEVESVSIDGEHKTSEQVESELKSIIEKVFLNNKILTIRLSGTLESGRPSDINFHGLFSLIKEKGCYAILKNSSALTSKEFEDIRVEISNTQEVEERLIREHIKEDVIEGINAFDLAKKLMIILDINKQEGERVMDFENRIKDEVDRLITYSKRIIS